MSTGFRLLALVGVSLLVAGRGSTAVGPSWAIGSPAFAAVEDPGAPGPIDPGNFTTAIDNPWFPLPPGATLTYRGEKDHKAAERLVAVTNRTAVIDGVTCVVVEDKLSFSGTPGEKNLGYYAQDRKGNVWIFGEDSQELDENGRVVNTDSWRAGLDGASPSFFMEATPTVGHSFAHNYTKNYFAVLSLSASVKVPYGSFADALQTKEWSPLERDVLTHKYYVRGVGEVHDVTVKGPKEEFVLVSVAR